jgi:Flp pilus assembly protein TadB
MWNLFQGFGVALKLTFAGNNQLTHISTYVFGVVVVGCILIQMVRLPSRPKKQLTYRQNFFNRALDTFSTNVYALPCSW